MVAEDFQHNLEEAGAIGVAAIGLRQSRLGEFRVVPLQNERGRSPPAPYEAIVQGCGIPAEVAARAVHRLPQGTVEAVLVHNVPAVQSEDLANWRVIMGPVTTGEKRH